jgi:hypothetical protein
MKMKFKTLALAAASSVGVAVGSVAIAISYLAAFNLHSGYPLVFTFASAAMLLASVIGIDLALEASRTERASEEPPAMSSD